MKKIIFIFFILSLITTYSCQRKDNAKEYVKKVALNNETIAVGIYKASGFEYHQIKYIAEALKIDAGMVYVTLTDEDVLKTKLENIDVIIFPEIENGQLIDKLDDELADIFKVFISKKGAIGLCNGCCMLLQTGDCQALNMVDLNLNKVSEENSLWYRIGFNLTEEGLKMFPELKNYNNLFIDNSFAYSMEIDTSTGNKILARASDSEIKEPLFITTKYNSGKIVIANAHPETTPGMRWILPRMVRWVYNKKFVSYHEKVFRPDFYSTKMLVDDQKKELEKWVSQLDDSEKEKVIVALDNLQNIAPYLVAEKVKTLLTIKNKEIKLRAAKFLVDIEYTLAIDDLKKATKKERNKKVKKQLVTLLFELENMIEQN